MHIVREQISRTVKGENIDIMGTVRKEDTIDPDSMDSM